MTLKLFHLSVVLLNCFTLWYDQMYIDIEAPEHMAVHVRNLPLKYRFVFITYWCLVLQTVYFALAFLNDLYGSPEQEFQKKPSKIKSVKDKLFSLTCPCAFFVSLMFWGIYAYDKTLVFPDYAERAFPPWVNHTIHTFILPFVLIEICLSPITYPSKLYGITVGVGFSLSYMAVVVVAYLQTRSFVYPLLDAMTTIHALIFLVCAMLFGISLYFFCDALHSIVNPSKRLKKYKSC